MINELKKQESDLKEELEALKKHSNAIHMKLIRLDKWLERNNYKRPYTGSSDDLNIIKYHRLVYDLSQVDIEINDVKNELINLQHDLYFLELGSLVSAYAKGRYHIRIIDNINKNIEDVYCSDYSTYLNNKNATIIVYELVKQKNSLPYEKIIYVQGGIKIMNCKEILDKIHKDKNNFIYKYGEIPNSIFISEDVLTRLLKFNEFREKVSLTLDGIEIFGCKIYKTLDENIFFKIALV